MRAYDIILKKRNGMELSAEDINQLIIGYMSGSVPDYQMAAFVMTVFFQGMSARETSDLTMAIVASGDRVDLSGITGNKVDKHSTGGVGDKTTLVLGPLAAAAGVPVAKMSGRGLGHTGGTIDKLESIPGFNTSLEREIFIQNVNRIGISIGGQTGNLAPADKKLYALRDVTATVDSIPLIASSVMSKKIAAGADAILLDVKIGDGAFMKNISNAVDLAKAMVEIGTHVGKKTIALITDMEQPLGQTVGNALEVREAVQCLMGEGPSDLKELCLVLGSHMVYLGGQARSIDEARSRVERIINNGKAIDKFRELVVNQGGDPSFIDDLSLLPQAAEKHQLTAVEDGYISELKAEQIGIAAMTLGAGRETKDSQIDLSVGIELYKKRGDRVLRGETLAILHVNDAEKANVTKDKVQQAFVITKEPPVARKLVWGQVTAQGVELY
ncbi:pyrimidine-nucleoside phosphorylase [Phosphitispora sp. TUW77]|uniref:pyrimidine-nucleoside phosphorylase n=1 Tax=Phosphitispora sp. TUW77 TaxID=3152361 RepID=UPI003AB8B334